MDIQEIITKALGAELEAYVSLNQKQALFLPMTREEEKKLAEFRKKIIETKNKEEKAPRLTKFAEDAKALQTEFGFSTAELIAALKGQSATASTGIVVGTFDLSAIKFKPVDKDGKPVMGGDGKPVTQFEWKIGQKYGPGWKSKAVAAIIKSGLPTVEKYATPEFKAWLEISRDNLRGGGKIFENKRAFLKQFGLKEDGTKIPAAKKA